MPLNSTVVLNERFTVRNILPAELPAIHYVERLSWPDPLQADISKFASRMRVFPEGVLGAFLDGQLIGVSTSMLLKDTTRFTINWEHTTADGYCSNHDNDGAILYIVSLGVLPEFRNQKIGSLLIQSQLDLARTKKVHSVVVGARCPYYHLHKQQSIEDYIQTLTDNHERIDPEIRFYERMGFDITGIVADFMSEDSESGGYGIIMKHKTL